MKDALEIARERAEELVVEGAEAVVLVGSHARGEASADSDLDLLAVGDDSYLPRLEVRDDLLVSVSMQRASTIRRDDLGLPNMVCSAVPGWRGAKILEDPDRIAAALVDEARSWTWGLIEEECDAWVAKEIAGNAEEVHKLVGALRRGDLATASVQRALLALHLAPILAVHRRILYGSENRMWDLVSEAMGDEWTDAQAAALGLSGEPLDQTCRAALKLYGFAVKEAFDTMNVRQRAVVERARELAQSASL